eukprot:snap_masked-scaffold_14-processed-gene-5.54-mRNA-1 protein AED:0.12 eAED:0.12 QI:0/0/0/1/1/1/2/0/167
MQNQKIKYRNYEGEKDIVLIKALIGKDLSEPYSVFTFPELSFLAFDGEALVGVVVCKIDKRKVKEQTKKTEEGEETENSSPKEYNRGYIGMLTVDEKYRRAGIGSKLVTAAIEALQKADCVEVVLETETKNTSAIQLYQRFGFIKDKRMEKYYLNGGDAFRLKKRTL